MLDDFAHDRQRHPSVVDRRVECCARRHARRQREHVGSRVARFERENPDVRVRFNIYDHESYKKAIRNWLAAAPPDVVFWFAGQRMRQFVEPGLLADVSELYGSSVRASLHPSAIELVSAG